MLKQNELVEQFNTEEQKRRSSILRKLKRCLRKNSKKFRIETKNNEPVDCIGKKWIE